MHIKCFLKKKLIILRYDLGIFHKCKKYIFVNTILGT